MSARQFVVVFLLLEHAAAFAPTNAIELLKRPAASRALPCLMAIKKKKEVAAPPLLEQEARPPEPEPEPLPVEVDEPQPKA
jgi:hypothetical protein